MPAVGLAAAITRGQTRLGAGRCEPVSSVRRALGVKQTPFTGDPADRAARGPRVCFLFCKFEGRIMLVFSVPAVWNKLPGPDDRRRTEFSVRPSSCTDTGRFNPVPRFGPWGFIRPDPPAHCRQKWRPGCPAREIPSRPGFRGWRCLCAAAGRRYRAFDIRR